jgi:hypothetical protein
MPSQIPSGRNDRTILTAIVVPRNGSSGSTNTTVSTPVPQPSLSPFQVARISLAIGLGVVGFLIAAIAIYWWNWGQKREWGKRMRRDLEAARMVKLSPETQAALRTMVQELQQAQFRSGRTDDGLSAFDAHGVQPPVNEIFKTAFRRAGDDLGFEGDSQFLLMSESGYIDDATTVLPSDSLSQRPRRRDRAFNQQEFEQNIRDNVVSSVRSHIDHQFAALGLIQLDTVEQENGFRPLGTQPYQQSQQSYRNTQSGLLRQNTPSGNFSAGRHSGEIYTDPSSMNVSFDHSSSRHAGERGYRQSPVIPRRYNQSYELDNLSDRYPDEGDSRNTPLRSNSELIKNHPDQFYEPTSSQQQPSREQAPKQTPMRRNSSQSHEHGQYHAQLAATGYIPSAQLALYTSNMPSHSSHRSKPSPHEQLRSPNPQRPNQEDSDPETSSTRNIQLLRPGESVLDGGVSDFQDRETAFTDDPFSREANRNYEDQRREEMPQRGLKPRSSEEQTRAWIDSSLAESPYTPRKIDRPPSQRKKGKWRRE